MAADIPADGIRDGCVLTLADADLRVQFHIGNVMAMAMQ